MDLFAGIDAFITEDLGGAREEVGGSVEVEGSGKCLSFFCVTDCFETC